MRGREKEGRGRKREREREKGMDEKFKDGREKRIGGRESQNKTCVQSWKLQL